MSDGNENGNGDDLNGNGRDCESNRHSRIPLAHTVDMDKTKLSCLVLSCMCRRCEQAIKTAFTAMQGADKNQRHHKFACSGRLHSR